MGHIEINYYKAIHVYQYSTSLISSCYCIILHHAIASWYCTVVLHHIAPWYCTMLQQNRFNPVVKQGHSGSKTGSFRIICQSFKPPESISSIFYQTHEPKN